MTSVWKVSQPHGVRALGSTGHSLIERPGASNCPPNVSSPLTSVNRPKIPFSLAPYFPRASVSSAIPGEPLSFSSRLISSIQDSLQSIVVAPMTSTYPRHSQI